MVELMGEAAVDNSGAGAVRHIYVHIPFCARICPYCAFYKERADPAQAARFCAAILAELPSGLRPETIFFGGGTPTALTTAQLEMLLGGFRAKLDLSELREWTVEANPGSVSAAKGTVTARVGCKSHQSWRAVVR